MNRDNHYEAAFEAFLRARRLLYIAVDEARRSLAAWQQHFGAGFCPMLIFAYHLVAGRSPLPPDQLFEFRGDHYGFLGVRLDDYVSQARPHSDSRETVA